jgi:hypothetical protein
MVSTVAAPALVADGVAVKGRGGAGDHVRNLDVGIREDHPPAGHRVRRRGAAVRVGAGDVGAGCLGKQVVQAQVTRAEGVVVECRLGHQWPRADIDQGRRDTTVVHEGGRRREALLADQLLVVQVSLGGAVLGVADGR